MTIREFVNTLKDDTPLGLCVCMGFSNFGSYRDKDRPNGLDDMLDAFGTVVIHRIIVSHGNPEHPVFWINARDGLPLDENRVFVAEDEDEGGGNNEDTTDT